MSLQVDDGICDELTRAMERGLATAEGFDKVCSTKRSLFGQVVSLGRRDGANVATAAGVDWVEVGSDDGWRWRWRWWWGWW